MRISRDIQYVGVYDQQLDLFESQYAVPHGMTYNSYVILDEKIAVMDSVEKAFADEWLQNIAAALNGRTPDYLIVQHMEPDHSANIAAFMDAYPTAAVVASQKAFAMMSAFFGTDYANRRVIVRDGDTLHLGAHTLTFLTAPMVHWPEVIVTYDQHDKVLFSADSFGRFGAPDASEPWADEARRYYVGIVGKYGAQVQALLKKAAALEINAICPLHGPALTENLNHYLNLYHAWSSYTPEEKGVVIACTSVYGHTQEAARLLYEKLLSQGTKAVIYDLARDDMSRAVADAFRFAPLVLATTTYNADIFPPMRHFIWHLAERNFQKRTVGLIENGSWAPMAAKVMREMLAGCKELTFAENTVKITSALSEASLAQLDALADEL